MATPGEKPLDLGTGRVCASFDLRSAAWLSFAAPHARHGFVELSAVPPFDESQRGDPDATRRYREALTDAAHAFLRVECDGAAPSLVPDPADPASPRWTGEGLSVRVETPAANGPAIRQTWSFGRHPGPVRLVLRARIDQPALAEITETDPPSPTGAATRLAASSGGTVTIVAADLPWRVIVSVRGATVAWTGDSDAASASVSWPAGAERHELVVEVREDGPVFGVPGAQPSGGAARGRMTARALAYVRGCTGLLVQPHERAFVTDHRILPLSWTRDAYWQALLLLVAAGDDDRLRVADHLRWLWRRCERPDARWVRSHHADGRRKDLAFQADQQLYPMIELADYGRATGDLPGGVDWQAAVPAAWAATLAEVDPAVGLLASAENAADDPAPAPFLCASQVLLWYTAARLADLAEALPIGLEAASLRGTAARARDAFAGWFAADAKPWPHAVDGTGTRFAYHDANDLPIALAPAWGFCPAEDPAWRSTMAFAFSDANPGWSGGTYAGLGSVHTPGVWTLGIVQAWIHARAIGDRATMEASMARLEESAYVDAMLPETFDGGSRRLRQWFAWPGAAIGALLLLDQRDAVEATLRPTRVG